MERAQPQDAVLVGAGSAPRRAAAALARGRPHLVLRRQRRGAAHAHPSRHYRRIHCRRARIIPLLPEEHATEQWRRLAQIMPAAIRSPPDSRPAPQPAGCYLQVSEQQRAELEVWLKARGLEAVPLILIQVGQQANHAARAASARGQQQVLAQRALGRRDPAFARALARVPRSCCWARGPNIP